MDTKWSFASDPATWKCAIERLLNLYTPMEDLQLGRLRWAVRPAAWGYVNCSSMSKYTALVTVASQKKDSLTILSYVRYFFSGYLMFGVWIFGFRVGKIHTSNMNI